MRKPPKCGVMEFMYAVASIGGLVMCFVEWSRGEGAMGLSYLACSIGFTAMSCVKELQRKKLDVDTEPDPR